MIKRKRAKWPYSKRPYGSICFVDLISLTSSSQDYDLSSHIIIWKAMLCENCTLGALPEEAASRSVGNTIAILPRIAPVKTRITKELRSLKRSLSLFQSKSIILDINNYQFRLKAFSCSKGSKVNRFKIVDGATFSLSSPGSRCSHTMTFDQGLLCYLSSSKRKERK